MYNVPGWCRNGFTVYGAGVLAPLHDIAYEGSRFAVADGMEYTENEMDESWAPMLYNFLKNDM